MAAVGLAATADCQYVWSAKIYAMFPRKITAQKRNIILCMALGRVSSLNRNSEPLHANAYGLTSHAKRLAGTSQLFQNYIKRPSQGLQEA